MPLNLPQFDAPPVFRGAPRKTGGASSPILCPMGGKGILVTKLRETMMILALHRQGLSVSAIARQTVIDRKTVRKYIERGLEVPAYGPWKPREAVIDPFATHLRERVKRYPGLTGSRLLREVKERGYSGGYTAVMRVAQPPEPSRAARHDNHGRITCATAASHPLRCFETG